MPGPRVSKVVARLRRAADPAASDSDRDLLTRFLEGQDEGAFETLVRRHERLIWSAVGKVLSDPLDAEDAFQATFLVLVRRAKQLDGRAGLGPWLYGVAHRVAVKARATGRARKRQEARATPAGPTPPADLSWQEACDLLHAELDRLPETYRTPLLLCHLEGKTRDEVAAALGVTVATVRGRLERGREALRARLTRRGVTLSVGLLTAVATSHTAGAGSPAALAAVLDAVRGSASARVVALSQDTIMLTILSKLTRSAVLTVGLVAAAATLTSAADASRADGPASDERTSAPKAGPAGAAVNPADSRGTREPSPLRVLVLAPDGKPASAATVRVWGESRQLAEGKTDANGRAELTVAAPPEAVVVAASAAGFAPDWVEYRPGAAIQLRLLPDDATVQGRVIDLEGRPVANCPIVVERVGRPAPGTTLDQLIASYGDGYTKGLSRRGAVAAEAAGLHTRVTTDGDGRFRLPGIGKDRVVWLTTRGETTEHAIIHVVTRALDPKQEKNGPFGLFGATFTLRLAPARPITGTVKDAETGNPIAGMRVAGEHDYSHCETVSDKDGRYTLHGLPKTPRYRLRLVSAGEAPYFERVLAVEDTPGFGPITADVPVRRGVVLTGRVTDPDGRPVQGRMFYFPDDNNPKLNDYPGAADLGLEFRFQLTPWGWLDANGRYRVLAVPGPGVLGVCATPEARYTQLNKMAAIRLGGLGFPSDALHALDKMNVNPADPKSLARDFRLAFGTTRTVRLDFPSGRPKTLLALGDPEGQRLTPVAGDSLTVTGLSPKIERALILMDESKTVGAFVALRGDTDAPLTVQVDKLASVTGRLLDAAGKPLARATVFLSLELDREKYDNLPAEFFEGQGILSVGMYYMQAWRSHTTRRVTTDGDGRFTATGLFPGQPYRVGGGYPSGNSSITLTVTGKTVTAPAPGKTHDIGDLRGTRD